MIAAEHLRRRAAHLDLRAHLLQACSEFIPSSVWKTAPQRSVSIRRIDQIDNSQEEN